MVTSSFTVLIYQLSLGAADATTGWFAMQYTAVSGKAAIIQKGSSMGGPFTGLYARTDALAVTDLALQEGDIIKDSYTNVGRDSYWKILAKREYPWGDVLVKNEFDLARMLVLPFLVVPGGGVGGSIGGYDPAFYNELYYAHYTIAP